MGYNQLSNGKVTVGKLTQDDPKMEINGDDTSPMRVKQATIAYDDSGVSLMTIPDGAKIQSIDIDVTTGFDGTTPTYDIGYSGTQNALVDGVSLSSTADARNTADPADATEWNGVTDGALEGTFVGGGSNTAGEAVLKIAYYE